MRDRVQQQPRPYDPATAITDVLENQAEYWLYRARAAGWATGAEEGITWYRSGEPVVEWNGIVRTAMPPDRAPERVLAAREAFAAARLPFTWWDPPAALEDAVIAAGLQAVSRETAMAADLTRFPEHAAAPAELVIERVADVQGALRWRETFRAAHGAPTSPNTARPRTFAPASYDEGEPLRLYSAHLRGMPVATAQLFMGAGVAGVYCVATVPHARRQGAGAAVTAAALRDARALGYYAGVLGATEMGASVYRGLGFAPCGELSEFVWEPQ